MSKPPSKLLGKLNPLSKAPPLNQDEGLQCAGNNDLSDIDDRDDTSHPVFHVKQPCDHSLPFTYRLS